MPASPLTHALALLLCLSGAAYAQPAPDSPASGPMPLVVYFGSGSAAVRAKDEAVLDRASRAFNEGHPVIMSINGSSDKVGSPGSNLLLSQQRASSVLRAMVARGIPLDRFQLVAKGETEPAVNTPEGVADERNRRVEISWR